MKKVCKEILRVLVYLFGLTIIAIGINLSEKSALGISPVGSVSTVLSKFTGASFGSMIAVVYCALVPIQLLILRKKFRPVNLLGIPMAVIFGLAVDIFGVSAFTPTLAGIPIGFTKTYRGLLMGLPKIRGGYTTRMMYLLLSVVAIGVGIFLYMRQKLIPLPTEGLASSISEVSSKTFGKAKLLVDISMLTAALILQVILLGGLNSFIGKKAVAVREGTLLSALLVRQVVRGLNRAFPKKKKYRRHHENHAE